MVTVDQNVIAANILQQAIEKYCACDYTLPRTTFRLLYPDGQLVEYLPGSQLMGYKLFMGKLYQKLLSFICDTDDYTAGIQLH